MNKDSIQNFKVMDWLRTTRDELSLQYASMSADQRRLHFAKEQWLTAADVVLESPLEGKNSSPQKELV